MSQKLILRETAQNRMITRLPVFPSSDEVGKVVKKLALESWDSIDWIYVADKNEVLEGVVPIQKLLSSDGRAKISEIAQTPKVTVSPETDQEKIAILAIENDIQQIPVVNKIGKLVGAVPSNQIIDILHDEHLEDLLRATGVATGSFAAAKLLTERILALVVARSPWLILGLFGGFIATKVVSLFENSFTQQISLAFFVPVIVYMADAIGTQTQTIFIRTLSFAKVNFAKYMVREILVSSLIGAICAVTIYFFALFWLQDTNVPLIVGLSLFLSMATAPIPAIVVPSILYFVKKDPAIGSGPFTTIVQDITTLIIYFLVVITLL